MKFFIYDKETGIIAKLVGVPNPDYLHLNNTNEDAYVQVSEAVLTFDADTLVVEVNGELFVEQAGERLDIVVEGGYHGKTNDVGET